MCILPWVSNIHPNPPPPKKKKQKKQKKKKKNKIKTKQNKTKTTTLQYVHLPNLLHKHESKSMLGNYALITKG